MPKAKPKARQAGAAPVPAGTGPNEPAERAIEVALRVLTEHRLTPNRPKPDTLFGLDSARRNNQIFFFEIFGTDQGGVVVQLDNSLHYPEEEFETAKTRAVKVNESGKCFENGERVMRLEPTQPRLGSFKLMVIAKIQPEPGQAVISQERFQQRFLLDAHSLFTHYEVLKSLE